jgi:hypothetical protein
VHSSQHGISGGTHVDWFWKSDGRGGWDIFSVSGDVIAYDIPYGAIAEEIVKIHNDALEKKQLRW